MEYRLRALDFAFSSQARARDAIFSCFTRASRCSICAPPAAAIPPIVAPPLVLDMFPIMWLSAVCGPLSLNGCCWGRSRCWLSGIVLICLCCRLARWWKGSSTADPAAAPESTFWLAIWLWCGLRLQQLLITAACSWYSPVMVFWKILRVVVVIESWPWWTTQPGGKAWAKSTAWVHAAGAWTGAWAFLLHWSLAAAFCWTSGSCNDKGVVRAWRSVVETDFVAAWACASCSLKAGKYAVTSHSLPSFSAPELGSFASTSGCTESCTSFTATSCTDSWPSTPESEKATSQVRTLFKDLVITKCIHFKSWSHVQDRSKFYKNSILLLLVSRPLSRPLPLVVLRMLHVQHLQEIQTSF